MKNILALSLFLIAYTSMAFPVFDSHNYYYSKFRDVKQFLYDVQNLRSNIKNYGVTSQILKITGLPQSFNIAHKEIGYKDILQILKDINGMSKNVEKEKTVNNKYYGSLNRQTNKVSARPIGEAVYNRPDLQRQKIKKYELVSTALSKKRQRILDAVKELTIKVSAAKENSAVFKYQAALTAHMIELVAINQEESEIFRRLTVDGLKMSNDFNERNATAPKEYERVERTRINKASNKTDYFERSPSGAFIFPENGRPNSFNINWSKIRNIISSSGTGSLTESDMGSLTEGDQSSLTESDMGSLTEGDQSSLTEGDMGSLTE